MITRVADVQSDHHDIHSIERPASARGTKCHRAQTNPMVKPASTSPKRLCNRPRAYPDQPSSSQTAATRKTQNSPSSGNGRMLVGRGTATPRLRWMASDIANDTGLSRSNSTTAKGNRRRRKSNIRANREIALSRPDRHSWNRRAASAGQTTIRLAGGRPGINSRSVAALNIQNGTDSTKTTIKYASGAFAPFPNPHPFIIDFTSAFAFHGWSHRARRCGNSSRLMGAERCDDIRRSACR
jgi:hypothetical protein